uniref:solute carrier family 22 member 21-like n=1 Tax=Ciona intestinalis TaxID=7719 RepID=UPI000EF482C9|nr:solute carrier family 22 member 21-like [Ciona intestinalis]|eukprot:XP_018670287.2 solute carrier family 22 member 21-like [Ciona intestinalis]
MFSLDNVIENVVGNGRYQAFICLCFSAIGISACYMNTASVFVGAMPDSRCRIEPYDNITSYPNLTKTEITTTFIPLNDNTKKPDRCQRYAFNTSCKDIKDLNCLFGTNNVSGMQTVQCDAGYEYDRSSFEETIVTEWDLVCDKVGISFIATSLNYAGLLTGSLMGGLLADRFGRIAVFRVSSVLALIVTCGMSFSPNVHVYTALRFLAAVTYFPMITSGFVYMIELSRKRWRTAIGLSHNAIFGLSSMTFSVLALIWRHWRTLQIAKSITAFVPFIILGWLVPESPRWLFAHNKQAQSKQVCEVMAKRNKTQLSEEVWQDTMTEFNTSEKTEESKESPLRAMCRLPCTRFLMLCNMFVWMVTSMVYYGLVLNVGNLPGGVYLNNTLGGLMEFTACVSSIFAIKKIGFTKCTSASLYTASLTCLLSTVCLQLGNGKQVFETLSTVLAMVGRFAASMSFGVIYVHTTEMFPTVGRSTALGLSSMSARIGSIFSPFTIQLHLTIPWLTPVMFGTLAFVAAYLAGNFPDTAESKLTMLFDDVEKSFSEHFHGRVIAKLFCLPTSQRRNTPEKQNTLLDDENSKC